MSGRRATLAALVLGAALAPAGPVAAKIIDRIVAVVNDEIILLSEVEQVAAPVLRQIEALPDPVLRAQQRDKQLRAALDDLVGQRLITQEAARRKLTVDPEDVQARIDQIKSQNGWDDEQLRRYLELQGMSLATLREQVRDQILRSEVIRGVLGDRLQINDRDVRDHYRNKYGRAGEVELEAAHILLPVDDDATPAEDAAQRQLAQELLERAKAGEDFAELARKYSKGPAAENGGYLGSFRRGSLDPVLEEALFSLPAGGVGGPVRTRFGWHVLKAVSREQVPPPPFEQVADTLRRELMEQRMQKEVGRWVEELKRKAFIEVRL